MNDRKKLKQLDSIFKEYGFSPIEQECEKLNSLSEQIAFLKSRNPKLHRVFHEFLYKEFNGLAEDLRKNILNWYNSHFNETIKALHKSSITFQSLDKEKLHICIPLKIFINKFSSLQKNVLRNTYERNVWKEKVISEFLKSFGFNLQIADMKRLYDIEMQMKRFISELTKAEELLEVKIVFSNYRTNNKEYEFEHCVFDEVTKIKKFANHLETYQSKLVYLKYCYEFLWDQDDREFIYPEIVRIENVLELKKNMLNINEIEKDEKIKESIIVKKLKKFRWNSTEESILRLIDLLALCSFIPTENASNKSAIIRDTFLNKEGKPFKNTQLNSVYSQMDQNKKISKSDPEYIRFDKLHKELQKLLDT